MSCHRALPLGARRNKARKGIAWLKADDWRSSCCEIAMGTMTAAKGMNE
jgi:hypothetical protein